jgi:hypothetical protein
LVAGSELPSGDFNITEHDPFIDDDYFIVELPTKDGYFP